MGDSWVIPSVTSLTDRSVYHFEHLFFMPLTDGHFGAIVFARIRIDFSLKNDDLVTL